MNEAIDVAELQLHRGTHVVEPDHSRVGGDDLQTALDTAPVVVRDLEDEQVFEDVPVHCFLPRGSWQHGRGGVLEACYFYPVRGRPTPWPSGPAPEVTAMNAHRPRRGHGLVMIGVPDHDRLAGVEPSVDEASLDQLCLWQRLAGSGCADDALEVARPGRSAQAAARRPSRRLLVTTKRRTPAAWRSRRHALAPG